MHVKWYHAIWFNYLWVLWPLQSPLYCPWSVSWLLNAPIFFDQQPMNPNRLVRLLYQKFAPGSVCPWCIYRKNTTAPWKHIYQVIFLPVIMFLQCVSDWWQVIDWQPINHNIDSAMTVFTLQNYREMNQGIAKKIRHREKIGLVMQNCLVKF